MSKVMVVDDEVHLRVLYKTEFENEGYQVEVAANEQEAHSVIASFRPDVVILDIELGDGNGLHLLKKIREVYRDCSIILHTAYSTYKSDFQSWLADAYIIKSSDLQPLKDKVAELSKRESCGKD